MAKKRLREQEDLESQHNEVNRFLKRKNKAKEVKANEQETNKRARRPRKSA